MSELPTHCINCERSLVPGIQVWCDRQPELAWCEDCYEKTACAAGVHGEGCATRVASFNPTPNTGETE